MIINIPFSPSRLDSTEFMDNFLRKLFTKKKSFDIADIGCGKMFIYDILKNYSIKGSYFGLDINVTPPKDKIKSLHTKIVESDFLTYSTKRKFDLVTCLWVLEHIKDDKKAFNKLVSLARKKGIIIVAVPSIYSWPIELGRHGFHYYPKDQIKNWAIEFNLKTERTYESAGLLGLIFMLLYSWPRFLVLPFLLIAYFILKKIGIEKRGWGQFSSKIIANIFYSYHRNKKLLHLHNAIVRSIVFLDNKFKVLPASYIYVLRS